MPEQITKYPEVTLKVLKESGARCGEGTKQKILTHCPPEQFCALPNGEICVYGIDQIPQMTQIKTDELARIVCPPGEQASMTSLPFSGADMALTRIVQVITEASGRISQVLGETTRDIVALFRPELAAAGKILGALGEGPGGAAYRVGQDAAGDAGRGVGSPERPGRGAHVGLDAPVVRAPSSRLSRGGNWFNWGRLPRAPGPGCGHLRFRGETHGPAGRPLWSPSL